MGCSCAPGALIKEPEIHQPWKPEELQVRSHTPTLLLSLPRPALNGQRRTPGSRKVFKKKLRLKGGVGRVRLQLQPSLTSHSWSCPTAGVRAGIPAGQPSTGSNEHQRGNDKITPWLKDGQREEGGRREGELREAAGGGKGRQPPTAPRAALSRHINS